MKKFLKKRKNIIFGTLLLFLGIGIGATLTTLTPLVSVITSLQSQPQPSTNDEKSDEVKKQELEKYYRELTEAVSKGDWEKIYSSINPSDKKWFTLEDVRLTSGVRPFSVEYVVHSFNITGNTGLVDRTYISCSTEECLGENRKEQRSTKEYVYINNQWYQLANKEPSEKARQIAAYVYTNVYTSKEQKNNLANQYGGGSDDFRKIIRTFSISLENDPELLAYVEAFVENHKTESSKPNVYVEAPDVIQQPAQQTIIQQPSSLRCTSNTIGNYTYTNCY